MKGRGPVEEGGTSLLDRSASPDTGPTRPPFDSSPSCKLKWYRLTSFLFSFNIPGKKTYTWVVRQKIPLNKDGSVISRCGQETAVTLAKKGPAPSDSWSRGRAGHLQRPRTCPQSLQEDFRHCTTSCRKRCTYSALRFIQKEYVMNL